MISENGHYEPGAFDIRSGALAPAELAGVVAQIAAGRPPRHAALAQKGWWRHASRVCLPAGNEVAV